MGYGEQIGCYLFQLHIGCFEMVFLTVFITQLLPLNISTLKVLHLYK